MATQQLPEQLIAKYRSVQLDRLDRIEGCWRDLHDTAYSREREADLVRGFNALKNDSRAMGFADISFLCQKLEDLLFFARQRRYQVSADVDMLVTMALQFTAILIRRKFDAAPSGVDLTGFVRQMDEVLRLAQASDTPAPGPEQTADGEVEHISAATRQRLARVATTVYLESLNAWGGSVARLREAWDALVKEAASLEAVTLQALFAPERTAALSRARELGRPVEIFFDVGAHRVPGDVADALREAVRLALRHAVERGIEPSDQRASASKRDVATVRVRAREEGDRLEVVVEDDGRGADLEAIRRRGVDLGLLTQEQAAAASDESLVELLFHPRFSPAAAQPGERSGLDGAREAVGRVGGTAELWSRAGVGTSVVLRAPRVSRTVEVLRLGLPGSPHVFVIPSTWSVQTGGEPGTAPKLDLLGALGLTHGEEPGRREVVRLHKDGVELEVVCRGPPMRARADRICATDEDAPAEVVRVGGVDALLVRPERLLQAKPAKG